MIQRLLYSVAFAAALSIIQTESAEFSIKPNGKVSHEKTSIVRRACCHVTKASVPLDKFTLLYFLGGCDLCVFLQRTWWNRRGELYNSTLSYFTQFATLYKLVDFFYCI